MPVVVLRLVARFRGVGLSAGGGGGAGSPLPLTPLPLTWDDDNEAYQQGDDVPYGTCQNFNGCSQLGGNPCNNDGYCGDYKIDPSPTDSVPPLTVVCVAV